MYTAECFFKQLDKLVLKKNTGYVIPSVLTLRRSGIIEIISNEVDVETRLIVGNNEYGLFCDETIDSDFNNVVNVLVFPLNGRCFKARLLHTEFFGFETVIDTDLIVKVISCNCKIEH